jgi:hypothetical protein
MKKRIFKWGLGLVVLCLLLLLVAPSFNWDGSVPRPLKLVICDFRSGKPIVDAVVWLHPTYESVSANTLTDSELLELKERYQMNKMVGDTDAKGMVELRAHCPAGGGGSMFILESGGFWVKQILEINHPGFRPLLIPLASLLGEQSFPLSKKVLEAKVWLIPVPPDPVSKPIK